MTVIDRVRTDMTVAMKAGRRDEAGQLRLVLSELQKAAKDGRDDELTVLRRERKRRLEAAEQFRAAERPELAVREEAEAVMIAAYLPAQLGEAELAEIVADAVEQTGATGPRDMGAVMKVVMERSAGRADGKLASAQVRAALAG